jgi:uncharacterized protein (DUF1697 family)
MATYVGLLRAVNLGSHNKLRMEDLGRLLSGLGMKDARTLLQTGNVVFGSSVRSTARLEKTLETAAAERLGLETDFLVRTAEEWDALVSGNPFRDEAEDDPGHLLAVLLKAAPGVREVKDLEDSIAGRERVRTMGRVAYIVYPDGIGRSRLTLAVIERKLGTRGTGRNWNTVRKLADLAGRQSGRRRQSS